MNAKEVKVLPECPECGSEIVVDPTELRTQFQCSECDDLHEDKEDAKNCCKE